MLTIDILRHGETAALKGKLYGATDVPLSELGQQQLTRALAVIEEENVDRVITSPLQRCAWLAENMDCPVLQEQDFSEMNFGDWEGRNTSDLIASGVDFRHDIRKLSPSNGESFYQFATRVQTAWQRYIAQHSQHDEHHLLLTHGGVMRVLLGLILHIPPHHLGKLYIPHASWSRVSFLDGEPPVLWFMNRHA